MARYSLALRSKSLSHGGSNSRFESVIAWLAANEDFFTAASLALALLGDQSTLTYMWRKFNMIESHSSLVTLDHIIDGLEGMAVEGNRNGSRREELADMVVVCLVKGGQPMASTLQKFLLRDRSYDADVGLLVLSAATALSLSHDEGSVKSAMGRLYSGPVLSIEDILWPVDCLLKACSVREKVDTAIALLNATVPDCLRNVRSSEAKATPEFSLGLCKSLISRIIISDSRACDLLLSLEDYGKTNQTFWESIDYNTQLDLSLMKVNQDYPFLLHSSTRAWILRCLYQCQEKGNKNASNLSSSWVESCAKACMHNAGCSVEGKLGHALSRPASGLEAFLAEKETTRKLLSSKPGKGNVDFTMLVSALLILRSAEGSNGTFENLPTQAVLNAACYLAGRRSTEEPQFPIDGQFLMKQCTLANNVQAGANLIGGKNGLILDCCDILISNTGVDMETAETFLRSSTLDAKVVAKSTGNSNTFSLTENNYRLLHHMEDLVLGVRTYGDFEMNQVRGHVDPVFAAETCLRTWWSISQHHAENTVWLENWLRKKLQMSKAEGKSPHRLVCAALTRALIWEGGESSDSNAQTLGSRLNFSNLFLIQLVESCCGLVQAVPRDIAETIVEESSQDVGQTLPKLSVSPTPLDMSFEDSFVSATSSLQSG